MKAEVNHNTSVTDIAGGIEVEPVTVPSGGYRKTETQLGHALVANQSWSGDMPDQYRTKVDISYSGTTTSFYADDLYGRRLWFYNPVGYTARFMVGKRIKINAIWNGATSISVSINHPYAAMSGTLGDHTEIFNSPFQKGKTAALVLGFGHTGKGLRGRYQNFDYQGLTEPTGGVFPAETAESNAQLSIGASLLSQASLIRQLNDGVNDVYSVSHDTVGLVFDDDTVASTVEPVLDIRTQISLTDPSHNATYRTAAIQSYTSALSMIETAVLDQVGNTSSATPNAVGVTTLFAEANDAGQKFYQVTSSSVWYSVKPYLTGYSSTEETDILGFLNAGHTLILPQNGSLTKGNYTGVAYQSFKSDTSFGHNLDDSVITNTSHLKGGLLAPVETSFIEEELNLAGPGGGSSYGSDLQINPAAAGAKTGSTDLVVGSGPYPFSLSFTRSFRPDTNDGTTGGWTHNFAITGKRTSDGSLALGDRYAIDAARAMIALYVGREVLKGGHTVERTVTSVLIQNWLHKGLYNNIFKISQGSDAIEFVALADGSYYAPEGQAASFTLSGTGSSTTATYTSKSGAAMTLTATDSTARDFRVTGQAWPSGMNVTMTYPTATRMMVANGLGRSLTIDMSADGKLITKVTDETNRYVDYTYAGLNISDAVMHQSPTGSSQSLMKYSYSGDLLTGTTPPVATTATTSFTHNALGQLTSITQTDRGTTNIYANHWRTEVVDPSGAKQITKNDPYGRWVKVIDDNGNESTTYFDRLGRVKKSVAPEGNFVEYNYDRYHNVQSVSQNPKPASGLSAKTTSFTYEGAAKFRQVKTVTDPSNQTTTYAYFSTTGLLSSVTAPAASVNGGSSQSAVTSFTYNGNGQPLTMTNPNNIVTKFTYTSKGEVLKTIANDGGLALKTDYEYYAIGDLKKIIDNRGKITNFVYDYLRRRTSVTAPHGIQTDFIYDANGRLYQSKSWINSAWHINTRTYDAQGRVTQVTDNANKVTTISYDDINRAVTVTDPSLRKVKSIHNGLGQKVEVVSGLTSASEVHEFITYNANGTVATLKDGKSNLTSYTYDGFDRLITTVFPGGLTSTVNSFDANSRPTSVTSRGGDTVTTAYDALGRTLSRTVPGVGTYSYQYDKNSQVTKVLKGTEAISYTYDTLGRVIKEVDGYGRQMEYAYYDSTGKWDVKYNFPGAESNYWLRYATDDVGRLTTIREYDTTTLATYAYDTGSRVTSVTMGNGAVESFTYDTAGRLSTLTQNFAGTADDATWTYGHNDSGQVTSKTVSNSAYEWTPTFNSSTAYVTNTLNQYTAIDGINQSHDSNGNLTSDGSMTFVFNALNQMTEAKSSGVTIGSYEYDPLGRRKAKTASGLTTQYLWGGSQIMAEYSGSILLRRYVYGPGIDNPIALVDASGTKTYIHKDGLGSVIAVSNSAGTVIDKFTYDPFGNGASEANSPYKFAARRIDQETGLYYSRNRYYNPATGRFISADPIGYSDGMNMYAYVGNDPVNARDPWGLSKDTPTPSTPDPSIPGILECVPAENKKGEAYWYCTQIFSRMNASFTPITWSGGGGSGGRSGGGGGGGSNSNSGNQGTNKNLCTNVKIISDNDNYKTSIIRQVNKYLDTKLEQQLWDHYGTGGGQSVHLSPSIFKRVADFAQKFLNARGVDMSSGKSVVSFYDSKEFDGALGRATVYYQQGKVVGLYDVYDFDPKAWGVRSYFAEAATRIARDSWDKPTAFKISGGNKCVK